MPVTIYRYVELLEDIVSDLQAMGRRAVATTERLVDRKANLNERYLNDVLLPEEAECTLGICENVSTAMLVSASQPTVSWSSTKPF